jgi:hypothetical protein
MPTPTPEEIQAMSDGPTIIFLFIFIVATWLCSVMVDPFEKDD